MHQPHYPSPSRRRADAPTPYGTTFDTLQAQPPVSHGSAPSQIASHQRNSKSTTTMPHGKRPDAVQHRPLRTQPHTTQKEPKTEPSPTTTQAKAHARSEGTAGRVASYCRASRPIDHITQPAPLYFSTYQPWCNRASTEHNSPFYISALIFTQSYAQQDIVEKNIRMSRKIRTFANSKTTER